MIQEDRFKRIFEKVLQRINPDNKVIAEVDTVLSIVNKSLEDMSIDASCVKGGSIAKDTFLKGDHDADLFVRFAEHYRGKNLSDMLEAALKKSFPKVNISRIHGSRDYFQFKIKKIDYELVPVLMIHASNYKNAENVTDLSPEHVSWVERYTKKSPHLKGEIRLAKQFCKANNVYGAESYINGLSGHIIDIMVIHYGSFLKLIRHFASLNKIDKNEVTAKNPLVIDHEKHLKDPFRELTQSKISPLIIVDPIQADRNAAAALSLEKLQMFISACNNFLDSPSEEFFIVKPFSLEQAVRDTISKYTLCCSHNEASRGKSIKNFREIALKLIVLTGKTLEGSKDVVGTKALKAHNHLRELLQSNEFKIFGEGWNFDFNKKKSTSFFVTDRNNLSDQMKRQGPPIKDKEACQRFREKHSTAVIEGERIYATINRKYTQPEKLVMDISRDDYVKSRLANARVEMFIIAKNGKMRKGK